MSGHARLADRPEDLQRFGLGAAIEAWEDGLRTDPAVPGQYEWWYFDAHLDNGAKLVVVFHTKNATAAGTGLSPRIQIDLDLPDGRTLNLSHAFEREGFHAATDHCEVWIGPNHFSGDLRQYTIIATVDDVTVEAHLTGQTEPWRPGAGHIFYGDDEQQYFAWLPSVPYGQVRVTYRVGTEAPVTVRGNGYHDHNWGNVSLTSIINHWYWGRGAAGPYTFITAQIVSDKKFSYDPVTVFMLAEDGKVIADDQSRVTFAKSRVSGDPVTGKPVADDTSFTFDEGGPGSGYTVSYRREQTIVASKFVDGLSGMKKLAARLIGFDGAYLRFSGQITVERTGPGAESVSAPAIWELMYPGRTRRSDRA